MLAVLGERCGENRAKEGVTSAPLPDTFAFSLLLFPSVGYFR